MFPLHQQSQTPTQTTLQFGKSSASPQDFMANSHQAWKAQASEFQKERRMGMVTLPTHILLYH